MFNMTLLIVVAAILLLSAHAFRPTKMNQFRSRALNVLEPEVLAYLVETKAKYDRVSLVDSPESNAEAASLQPTAEKYMGWLKIKELIMKLRTMYLNEASPRRQADQLSAFIDLYNGKTEFEMVLRQKAGFPAGNKVCIYVCMGVYMCVYVYNPP
jgi:hypothetical protein